MFRHTFNKLAFTDVGSSGRPDCLRPTCSADDITRAIGITERGINFCINP